ncbi:glycosyltransferase [Patescibacteria group bacterium]|nr:glycosyltransferase [Patescibacteria group bacterium]
MKILLYSESQNIMAKSGVGKALSHQKQALKSAGVDFTTDPNDDYDLAHINTIGFGSEKILKKTQTQGKPVVYHAHTTFEDFRNSFIFSNTISHYILHRLKKLYTKADFLIFPSEHTKATIAKHNINTPGAVISNGVNTKEFVNHPEFFLKFKKEYNISKPVIVSIGLPFMRKGVFDFCEVASKLTDFEFFWFGAKWSSLLPFSVRKLLKNPPPNVHFPGYVPFEILLGAISGANLFFFPTYEENEGIVVLEALSAKCPVLIRDIPVYEKWMQDGVNCYKGRNNEEFVELIKKSITDPKREVLVKNGRETARTRDLEIVGHKLKKTYEKLLKEKELYKSMQN